MCEFEDDEYPVRGYGLPSGKLTCSSAITALLFGMMIGGAVPTNAGTLIFLLILVAITATLMRTEFKASMK